MLTRRRFLKLCSITGAGLMLPSFPLAGCGGDTTGETATQAPGRADAFQDSIAAITTG